MKIKKRKKAPKKVNLKHAMIGSHIVVKVGHKRYLFYSNTVDAPITYALSEEITRKYMKAAEVKQYGDMWEEFFDRRWERLQKYGTTEYGFGRPSAERAVQGNKAGPNYEELTFDALCRMYWSKTAWKNFAFANSDIIVYED